MASTSTGCPCSLMRRPCLRTSPVRRLNSNAPKQTVFPVALKLVMPPCLQTNTLSENFSHVTRTDKGFRIRSLRYHQDFAALPLRSAAPIGHPACVPGDECD